MREALQRQYENELNYIRRLAVDFARDRPKIADRLLLDRETGEAEDPHVERLIEAFAFLTARIRLKLEDDFPELTEALLGVLYPHYLAPIPSMAVVQFEADPAQSNLVTGHTIARHSRLYSRSIDGVACQFRTCYPVTLWPVSLADARYLTAPFGNLVTPPPRAAGAPAVIHLQLQALGSLPFSQMNLQQLRFFLSGDSQTVHTLYELMFNHVTQVVLRGSTAPGDAAVVLDPDCLQMVGFHEDEGLLPYGDRALLGHRLMSEYFTFPHKFLFVDLFGLEHVASPAFRDRLDVFLFLDRNVGELETRFKPDMLRLGCSPAVNLFTQQTDPIRLTQTKYEYQIVPDVRHPMSMEVYSIDHVHSVNLDTRQTTDYYPFYSLKHGQQALPDQVYWYARREPSLRPNDEGTDVFLCLADAAFDPRLPAAEVLMLETTCTNRNLPGELRTSGGESWGFQLEGHAPLRQIVPLIPPTPPMRLSPQQNRWRLISHLALNHLSIAGQQDGADALREMLKLYNYAGSKVSAQHIAGILSVASRRCVAPVLDGVSQGFCRGIEVTVELDEEKFVGTGAFLFAAVLDRFMNMYASINSATRLVTRSQRPDGLNKRWPFRLGDRIIL